jgi:hypothetical protein
MNAPCGHSALVLNCAVVQLRQRIFRNALIRRKKRGLVFAYTIVGSPALTECNITILKMHSSIGVE